MGSGSGEGINILGAVIVGLLIVAIGFGIYYKVKSGADIAGDKINSSVAILDEQDYVQYDGSEIYGSEVLNLISTHANDVICIKVNNGRTTTEYIYNSNLTTKSTAKLSDAKKKTNLNLYINPNTKYQGKLVRDESTNTIMELEFTKM